MSQFLFCNLIVKYCDSKEKIIKVEITTNGCTNTHSKSKTFAQQKFGKKRETNRGRKIREIKKYLGNEQIKNSEKNVSRFVFPFHSCLLIPSHFLFFLASLP